ncbi:MAG: hypothetical protein NTW38_04590 [Candidatus Aminicenantes bacterium]|nr:hypothetical protein [Candidatus Aminicenantes bacterium]
MSILACYAKGIRTASARPKIILLLWAANVLFASIAYVLFASVFASALGPSGAAAGLMKKADMNVLLEAIVNSGRPMGVMQAALFAVILIYFLVSIFLQGGILRGLVESSPEARSGRVFFDGGARYYGRFFRLAFCSLLLWIAAAVVFIVLNIALRAVTKNSTNEQLTFTLSLFKIAFVLFLVFLIKMIMDYARIRMVTRDANKALPALLSSARYVFGHPGSTLVLYYLLGLTGLSILALWRLVISPIRMTTAAAVWAGFFLTQLFIASRGWLHLAYQAAQLVNFQSQKTLLLYNAVAPRSYDPHLRQGDSHV